MFAAARRLDCLPAGLSVVRLCVEIKNLRLTILRREFPANHLHLMEIYLRIYIAQTRTHDRRAGARAFARLPSLRGPFVINDRFPARCRHCVIRVVCLLACNAVRSVLYVVVGVAFV